MLEKFYSDIIQTMKCFALESFNLSQAEHTKINKRLNFNPGLVLIAFWTTRTWSVGISFERMLHNMDKTLLLINCIFNQINRCLS